MMETIEISYLMLIFLMCIGFFVGLGIGLLIVAFVVTSLKKDEEPEPFEYIGEKDGYHKWRSKNKFNEPKIEFLDPIYYAGVDPINPEEFDHE